MAGERERKWEKTMEYTVEQERDMEGAEGRCE